MNKTKLQLKYDKYLKQWLVGINRGNLFFEVLYKHKDKDLCKLFIQQHKEKGGL